METASSIETEWTNFTFEQRETQQQAFDFENMEDMILTPETMKQMMDAQNMSIRQTAEEIGIAHTTLSRYLRKENKRQNKNNDEKMLFWLKEKSNRKKNSNYYLDIRVFLFNPTMKTYVCS